MNNTKRLKTKNNRITRRNKNTTPFPIDVVYTWKRENKSNNIRHGYNNEIKYSLRSIEAYAPWVNKIYILMNNKKQPSWIKENDKIIIVEHADTFPSSKYLPNTNSNAIETTISNIPGLSEHYIYFNDDFFLGNNVKYTDFFTPEGKAIVDNYSKTNMNTLKSPDNNKLNIEFPPNTDMLHKHIPIPQIKSVVIEFNNKYKDYIEWIRMTKKRKDKGYDICEANELNTPCQQIHNPIAKFMTLKNKTRLKDNTKKTTKMYVPSFDPKFEKKLRKFANTRPKFYCINDNETNPAKRKVVIKKMLDFFNEMYPEKPSFEK